MQLLLYNLEAHKIASRLLHLPVGRADDAGVRQVLLAVYRLLKALCSGFKVTQLALTPQIGTVLSHVELKLVAYDITPTLTLTLTLTRYRPLPRRAQAGRV